MVNEIKPECKGICKCCLDQDNYDDPQPIQELYRLRRHLVCGHCANELEGDREFAENAYGPD